MAWIPAVLVLAGRNGAYAVALHPILLTLFLRSFGQRDEPHAPKLRTASQSDRSRVVSRAGAPTFHGQDLCWIRCLAFDQACSSGCRVRTALGGGCTARSEGVGVRERRGG